MAVWRDNWKHLRVVFQLTLAPIFLWGALLSGAPAGWRLALGFGLFHFVLYTGITAFNSFYDRDQGPIGGLERPPAPDASLLPLSLALKFGGLALAPLCGWGFAAVYSTFVVLSFLYSHPRARWKASPILSTVVVCGGQGMLGFLAGWAAARGGFAGVGTADGVLGVLSAGFTTLGMYPITQVYQIEEDSGRGDRTLAVVLGSGGAFRLSQASFLLAGLAAVPLCWRRFGAIDAVVMGTAYVGIVFAIGGLRARFGEMDGRAAFRSVMRFLYGGSAAFGAFVLFEWVRTRGR